MTNLSPVEELAALRAQLAAAQDLTRRWNIAASNAGFCGSEYINDPEFVFTRIRQERGDAHEAKKDRVILKRQLFAAEQRLAAIQREAHEQAAQLQLAHDKLKYEVRWSVLEYVLNVIAWLNNLAADPPPAAPRSTGANICGLIVGHKDGRAYFCGLPRYHNDLCPPPPTDANAERVDDDLASRYTRWADALCSILSVVPSKTLARDKLLGAAQFLRHQGAHVADLERQLAETQERLHRAIVGPSIRRVIVTPQARENKKD